MYVDEARRRDSVAAADLSNAYGTCVSFPLGEEHGIHTPPPRTTTLQ